MLYEFGSYQIDENQFELRYEGRPVPTQPRVFELLVFLVKHRDRVVTKRELLDVLWGGAIVTDAAVRQAVKLARQALRQCEGDNGYIRTVHGRGFRFFEGFRDSPQSRTAL